MFGHCCTMDEKGWAKDAIYEQFSEHHVIAMNLYDGKWKEKDILVVKICTCTITVLSNRKFQRDWSRLRIFNWLLSVRKV